MAKPVSKKISTNKKESSSNQKKRPWLLPAFAALVFIPLIVYLPALKLGYTELDDSIFIRENHEFNNDPANLVNSFNRGVFNETEDIYYRPLLLDSFILNYQVSGDNIREWHLVNIAFHLMAVVLLFMLLLKLKIPQLPAFLLAILFAVHPVLTQAIAWIPGRNDSMLAVFVFSFFIGAIYYTESGSPGWLVLQAFLWLAALFTKETAVFAAPAAWLLVIFVSGRKWFDKSSLILYASWIIAFGLWYAARSQATLKHDQLAVGEVATTLVHRLPVLLQYLGKIILPVNLSVFPVMQDTSIVYGIIALLTLGLILWPVLSQTFNSKNSAPQKNEAYVTDVVRSRRLVVAGFAIFILFLIPALLVPASLNDQDFEHRLYLPILGILLVLGESILLKNKLKPSVLLSGGLVVIIVLSVINQQRQKFFNDPVTFWTEAVRTSPNSAYANMMLGARLDKIDKPKADSLVRRAYALNPNEKYVNYYMGVLMQQTPDSVLASEKYLLKELDVSDYFMVYFHLARVAFEKNDKPAAIDYLNKYLSRTPKDPQANNNLLLLYIETNQKEKGREHISHMRQLGIPVPAELESQLK